MIDFVKVEVLNPDLLYIEKYSGLEFHTLINESTGELATRKVAEHHFCKITIYESGLVIFSGSIHKLWNSVNDVKAPNLDEKTKDVYKGYNGNLFTIHEIFEVKEHLEKLFNCSSYQLIFKNLEIGVNTKPSFNPNIHLKGLLFHRGNLFEFRYGGSYSQVIHQRYIVKIYDKGKQYGISDFTQRVEVKILKSHELKPMGIKSFEDINSESLKKAGELLLKRFDEIVHYDYTIEKEQLSKHQKRLIENYSNPRYWTNDLKPNQRNRHKLRLDEITVKFSKNLHLEIRNEIIKKCSIINRGFLNQKCSINNTSSIGVNMLQSNLPFNANISPQKDLVKKPIKKTVKRAKQTGLLKFKTSWNGKLIKL